MPYSPRAAPAPYTVFREQALADGVLRERIRLTSNLGKATTARPARRRSLWLHDNALIPLGPARYGQHDEVRTLARRMVETAARQSYRPPEVLAGYSRADHPDPVPYPHSCSPQAWAAATPFALLTALEGSSD